MRGDSHCAGTLELKVQGEWRPVVEQDNIFHWTLNTAAVCREKDCGPPVSVGWETSPLTFYKDTRWIKAYCVNIKTALSECVTSGFASFMNLTCSGKPISDIIYYIIYDSNAQMGVEL